MSEQKQLLQTRVHIKTFRRANCHDLLYFDLWHVDFVKQTTAVLGSQVLSVLSLCFSLPLFVATELEWVEIEKGDCQVFEVFIELTKEVKPIKD